MEQGQGLLPGDQYEDAYHHMTEEFLSKDACTLPYTTDLDLSAPACSIDGQEESLVSESPASKKSAWLPFECGDTSGNEERQSERVHLWIRKAMEMGFSHTLIAEILSMATDPFESFEVMLDVLLVLQNDNEPPVIAEQAIGLPGAQHPYGLRDLEKMRQENETLRNHFSCKICFEREANVMAIPCGHMCICAQCRGQMSQQSHQCPVCCESPLELLLKDDPSTVNVLVVMPEERPAAASLEVEAFTLERANDILRRHRLCQVCKDKDRNQYFLPCNHVVLCKDCSQSRTECPTCNSQIAQRRTVIMG